MERVRRDLEQAHATTLRTTRRSTDERDEPPLRIQAKMLVGATDDPAEREADRLADDAVARLADDRVPAARRLDATRIARAPSNGAGSGFAVDDATERTIRSERSRGRPLDAPIRHRMEAGFGADFSGVRVHVGAASDALNDRVQARAFTAGSDVFVRRSEWAPATAQGERLLAHELAHTLQQGGTASTAPVRRTTDLDATQQAQWMDLGPDLDAYAKRAIARTTADAGGITEALAVLPRRPDGSLTPQAIAMVEAFEKGQWDSQYDVWMQQSLESEPDRKAFLGIKEGGKDYRKRVAKLAKKATSEITGRTTAPELANIGARSGGPQNVSRGTNESGVTYTVNFSTTDVNAPERRGMVRSAIAKIIAAGGDLGNDLEFNLPMYGRKVGTSADCKTVNVSDYGTRAVYVAPKYVHISSEILGNPNLQTESMTGTERLHYMSAQLDPDGVASIVHELGHYSHYRNDPSKFHSLSSTSWTSRATADLAMSVSGYAMGNPREFVAEVFLGLVYGRAFSRQVLEMYVGLGGMPIGAAAPVVATVDTDADF